MGQTHEEIIYSLKLDVTQTNESLKSYTTNATAAKKANEDLKSSTSSANVEADRQATAAKRTSDALKAEEGSIAALREQNKQLTKERNNTTLATEEGRKRVEELNKQLDKNNEAIKANVDAYTKQKIGIGGYTAALDKLVPGLGATINGIEGMTKSAIAFMATGWGLVILAAGAAIGALMSYFKSSEEGQNKWNKIMSIGSAIVEQFKNFIEDLGEKLSNPKQALIDLGEAIKENIINRFTGMLELIPNLGKAVELLFEGKFGEAATVATNAVAKVATGIDDIVGKTKKMIDTVNAAVNAGIDFGTRLANLQAEIDRREREMIVQRSQTNRDVAKLKEEAITAEGDARKKMIGDAIKLIQNLSDAELAQAKNRLAQAQLELQANGEDKEAKLKVAEATAAVIDAEAQRYTEAFKLQKQFEALDAQDLLRTQKLAADKAKAKKDAFDQSWADEVAARQAQNDELDRLAQEDFKKQQKAEADELKLKSATNKAEVGFVTSITKEKSAARTAGMFALKKDALNEIVISTRAGAIAAYKSLAGIPIIGPVLGAIAAGAVISYGVEQSAAIIGLGFAKGGKTRGNALSGTRIMPGMGIPIQRSNGDDMLATIKTKEVILNENQQAALGGSATFKKIGVPGFAGGGVTGQIETRYALDATQQRSDDVINAILNQPRKILVLQDFEAVQNAKDYAQQTAVVVQ